MPKECLFIVLVVFIIAFQPSNASSKSHEEGIAVADSWNKIQDSNKMNGDFSSNGVVLVTRYAEQQVGAAMNMFSLQKWAKSVGVFVVEPFVANSEFRLPIVTAQADLSNRLHFSDYFNIDTWNKMSIANNGTPLIPWETFVNHRPKKYIFVAIINNMQMVEKPIHINEEIFQEPTCKDTFEWFNKKYHYYTNQLLQVELARKVCLSFYQTKMSIENFTQIIYGNFNPAEVTVWIQIWKGFSKNNRVKIFQQHFHRNSETLNMLQTSERISDDSKKYIKNFLTSVSGSYIAVSVRTVVRAKYTAKENQMDFFHNCISKLGSVIGSLNNTDKGIFMSMDLGKFGDSTVERFLNRTMINYIERKLLQTVYNSSITMQQWEQSFVQATNGITDSGYIAAVQRTVLQNGRCLIMFGGRSNFQRSLLLSYKEGHSVANEACVYEVCYEQ